MLKKLANKSQVLAVSLALLLPLVGFAQETDKPDSPQCPYYKARLLGETIDFINQFEKLQSSSETQVLTEDGWSSADPGGFWDLSMSILVEVKNDWVENCPNDHFNEFLTEIKMSP